LKDDGRIQPPQFPLTALVGQEKMKLGLLLNAINPRIGGVLIRGGKGTAKSTAARGLADLLPEIDAVAGCSFACAPSANLLCDGRELLCGSGNPPCAERRRVRVVDLPIGATEDRLLGSLDVEHAIREGRRRFEPGLLARADRGILYVDEVNLLGDHLVDVLLDVATSGVNRVEREGVSFAHPARFILVGTMNPEEGDLRPQLLDRFGLAVEVESLRDPAQRIEAVRRRIAFEADPEAFLEAWRAAQDAERARIEQARKRLPEVCLDDRMLGLIAAICAEFEVDGLRADLVIYKTAQTLAAYRGYGRVGEQEVRDAAALALPHRCRRGPFEKPDFDDRRLDEVVSRQGPGGEKKGPAPPERPPDTGGEDGPGRKEDSNPPSGSEREGNDGHAPEQVVPPGPTGWAPPLASDPPDRRPRKGEGRRSRVVSQDHRGHYVGSGPAGQRPRDVAFDATLRAAAPFQKARQREGASGLALQVRPEDLQVKVRETRAGNLILFLVDASGSMGARQRMSAVKGAVLALLLDAYQRRDRVGLIAFRGSDASLLLPPTNSVEMAERHLRVLPTGGRTPLTSGLQMAHEALAREINRDRDLLPLLVLVSDGRANVAPEGGDPVETALAAARAIRSRGIPAVVVDAEEGHLRLGLAREISNALGGRYIRLKEVAAERVSQAVRQSFLDDQGSRYRGG